MIFNLEQNEAVLEELIQNNLYSQTTDPLDKINIRQYKYVMNNETFEMKSFVEDNNLVVQFIIDGDICEEHIPLECDDSMHEAYPCGEVLFKDIELLSVTFHDDFPWANEILVARYVSNPETADIKLNKENIRFLETYYILRDKADSSPPPECNGDEYQVLGEPMMNPNNFPWRHGSIYVPYVNGSIVDQRTEYQLPEQDMKDIANVF